MGTSVPSTVAISTLVHTDAVGICRVFCTNSAPHQNRTPFMRTTAGVYAKLPTPQNRSAKCGAMCRIRSHRCEYP
ncbi:unnamed protein product, partial [Staurois parvus]